MLATMHRKEQGIGPLVSRFLGLRLEVARIDTDVFGTFSRDVDRIGSPLEAARAKIAAAFAVSPDVTIGLASEGSFGPHPYLPFCSLDREIVVLCDRQTGLELVGQHHTLDTNFAHAVVNDLAAGTAFAVRIGFPRHGVIVMGCRGGQPAPARALIKDSENWDELNAAIKGVLKEDGSAFIETDMRAHRNPRRMRAIGRATIDLIRRARGRCPSCDRPGFVVTERLAGLPCADCGLPTALTRVEVSICHGCGWRADHASSRATADPRYCDRCNP